MILVETQIYVAFFSLRQSSDLVIFHFGLINYILGTLHLSISDLIWVSKSFHFRIYYMLKLLHCPISDIVFGFNWVAYSLSFSILFSGPQSNAQWWAMENIYSEILATLDYSLGKLWRVKFYANCKLGLKCFWQVGVLRFLSLFLCCLFFLCCFVFFWIAFPFLFLSLSFLRIPAQNPHCSLIQSQSAGFCTENCHSKSWA